MDRENMYTLCYNGKWMSSITAVCVVGIMIYGIFLRDGAGQAMFGCGFVVLPILGSVAYYFHLASHAFRPNPEPEQSHTP
ncbi:MAG: hypothetical protein ACYC6N_21550 [Pirellulaceae bacterium]